MNDVSREVSATASEFPGFANVFEDAGEAEVVEPTPDRRQFMALSSAALASAALTGCRRPDLEILPYAQTPENIVPGMPLFYATSMPRPGGCFPLLVETHEGRPTKIEGNVTYFSGRSDAYAQAAIYDLYSPDRSKQVLHQGKPSTWEAFDLFATEHFAKLKKTQGTGLRFLVEDHPSPSMRLLREHMKTVFPNAVWHCYEPINRDNSRAALEAVGLAYEVENRISSARTVLLLDNDFVGVEATQDLNAFELRRDSNIEKSFLPRELETKRFYAVESSWTITGAMVDHRLRLPSSHIVDYTVALAKRIAKQVPESPETAAVLKLPTSDVAFPTEWIDEVAKNLKNGLGIVLPGYRQPPLVHALCSFINNALGNVIDYASAAWIRDITVWPIWISNRFTS